MNLVAVVVVASAPWAIPQDCPSEAICGAKATQAHKVRTGGTVHGSEEHSLDFQLFARMSGGPVINAGFEFWVEVGIGARWRRLCRIWR